MNCIHFTHLLFFCLCLSFSLCACGVPVICIPMIQWLTIRKYLRWIESKFIALFAHDFITCLLIGRENLLLFNCFYSCVCAILYCCLCALSLHLYMKCILIQNRNSLEWKVLIEIANIANHMCFQRSLSVYFALMGYEISVHRQSFHIFDLMFCI